jgi:hypothetical protein
MNAREKSAFNMESLPDEADFLLSFVPRLEARQQARWLDEGSSQDSPRNLKESDVYGLR